MTSIIIINILYYITYTLQNQRENVTIIEFNQYKVNFMMLINIL